jgi:signal transduction histidine kinase
MSIRTKLLGLLAVPLLALAVLAGLGVRWSSQAASHSRATADRMADAVLHGAAALELSRERGLSVALAAAPDDAELRRELAFQRGQADVVLDDLRATGPDGGAARAPGLAGLGRLRGAADGVRPDAAAVLDGYTGLIDGLLAAGGPADAVTDADLAGHWAAYGALTRAVDDVALEQSVLVGALATGRLAPGAYERLVGLEASQSVWLRQFDERATPAQRQALADALATPSVATAGEMRAAAVAAGPGGAVEGDAGLWFSSMTRKVDLLRAAADTTAADLTAAAEATRTAAERRQATFLGLGAAAVLLVALLMALLHRIVVRPLRRLTAAAHDVATRSLPHAVEVAQAEGPDAARAATVPLVAASGDEVGELTRAFNAVQGTAVALAAEQAALRRNVNDVFVNMGRRTQNLITRQLAHIDHLERSTEDARALADLFLLDHLATRLRRNAESLLVLAGAGSPRPWGRPVSIAGVVRAAAAEATDYSRVDVDRLDAVSVLGMVVSDLSHLLAELVDNALAYSPPTERVVVTGRALGDGRYVVSVADRGIGLSDERLVQLNERIAHPPVHDLAMSKFFGLFVVGRLAQRHGVAVTLAPSPDRGVTAHVVVPAALLAAPVPPAAWGGPAFGVAGVPAAPPFPPAAAPVGA